MNSTSINARSLALGLALLGLALPGTSSAQEDMTRAQALFAREPTAAEVVDTALHYFRVNPEVLDETRRSAHLRGLLPILSAGYQADDDNFTRFQEQIVNPERTYEDTDALGSSVSVGAVWDLGQLVFNPAEVQVYGLIGVQRDIMLEATRTYYLRRQLLLRRLYRPPTEPMARAALDLRIEEFTSLIDVLTGGWFSKNIEPAR